MKVWKVVLVDEEGMWSVFMRWRQVLRKRAKRYSIGKTTTRDEGCGPLVACSTLEAAIECSSYFIDEFLYASDDFRTYEDDEFTLVILECGAIPSHDRILTIAEIESTMHVDSITSEWKSVTCESITPIKIVER